MTDELTTAIFRLPGAFVIARNTAFTFKGEPTDVKAIGKDLGVKYLLEGSVLPTATRIRVNAQLVDAESGAHLWAESFDEHRADLLQTEDDIVTRLARTLDMKMTDVEAAEAGRRPPGNLDAQDLALQCLAADAQDPVKHPEVCEFCEQALRLDPSNTRALALLGFRLKRSITLGADMTVEVKRLDELVRKAPEVNPNAMPKRHSPSYKDATMKLSSSWSELSRSTPSDIDAYSFLGDLTLADAEQMIAELDMPLVDKPWWREDRRRWREAGKDARASQFRQRLLGGQIRRNRQGKADRRLPRLRLAVGWRFGWRRCQAPAAIAAMVISIIALRSHGAS